MQRLLIRAALRIPPISLLLLVCCGVGVVVALEAGIVPGFDRQYTLYGQHMVVVRYGSVGISCRPDQAMFETCALRAAEKRELSLRYVSPTGAATWLVVPLPSHYSDGQLS
jgi:hypothetical protein